jgi:Tol biopolymer transport system component
MKPAPCAKAAHRLLWVALIAGCVKTEPIPTPSATTSPSASAELSPTAGAPTDSPPSPSSTPPTNETATAGPPGLVRLTTDPGYDRDPAWSPDGERIAFVSDRSGTDEVYSIGKDGHDLTRHTEDRGIEIKESPTWSPDGQRIAFAAAFDVYQIHAFEVEASVSQPFDVMDNLVYPLTNRVWNSMGPAWSPNGTTIAFTTEDRFGEQQVHLLDLSDGSKRQVTSGPVPAVDPSWSPDGSRIAFVSYGEGDFEIYVVTIDGAVTERLTHDSAFDSWPSWSPDGQFIVFSSDRSGSLELYIMRSAGTDVRRLDAGTGGNFDPAWSPDGLQIAFVSDRDGNDEIYRINVPALAP